MLIIGSYIEKVKCESFIDPETGRIRVKPLPNQGFRTDIVIECSMKIRNAHKVGTHFITDDVKVCKKPDGRIYLRAKGHMIYKVDK